MISDNDLQQQLRDYLSKRAIIGDSMSQLLLERGQFWQLSDLLSLDMKDKQCFRNAFESSLMIDAVYCEGFACSASVSFPVEHAWILDRRQRVIETTWSQQGLVYFGIAIDDEYLMSHAVKTRVYGLDWRLFAQDLEQDSSIIYRFE